MKKVICYVMLCCAVVIGCTKEDATAEIPEKFEITNFSEIDSESLITRDDLGEIRGEKKQVAEDDPDLE